MRQYKVLDVEFVVCGNYLIRIELLYEDCDEMIIEDDRSDCN